MSIQLTTMQHASDNMSGDNAAIWFAALLRADTQQGEASKATLLAWLIGLPDHLDPSQAAALVLAYQQGQTDTSLSDPLTALLQDVAIYPRPRLERLRSGRRHNSAARAS
jgi:hypothetical protein